MENSTLGRQGRTDVEMINDPDSWPLYPFLPVKNRKLYESAVHSAFGVIAADEPTKVKINTLDIKTPAFIAYPTVEALVADGWVVD
jgi:hypothetical protein